MNRPETNLNELWLEVAEAQGSAQQELSPAIREVVNQKLLEYLANPEQASEEQVELLDRVCAPVGKFLERVHNFAVQDNNKPYLNNSILHSLESLNKLALLYTEKVVKQNKSQEVGKNSKNIELLNRSRSDLHMNFYKDLLWMFEAVNTKDVSKGNRLTNEILNELHKLGMSNDIDSGKIFTTLQNYGDTKWGLDKAKSQPESDELLEYINSLNYSIDNILQKIGWSEVRADLALSTV